MSIDTLLLAAVLVVLLGMLRAMKTGFNEVIAGLEALAARHDKGAS